MIGPGGIEPGAVLAGRYRVDRVLGQGGMGIVVQAMHLQLHQPVAMKFLLPEVLGNPQVVQRFLREAQAAVRLKSEHVARVIDVGSLETGAPYMVLEYLEGADLSNFPRSQLSVGMVVDLMLQACEALAEAHSLGIVHRDIKPANFFITRRADGSPMLKVLDFGISKTSMASSQLTATQAVMGTPAYMSPEQMRSSRDVDHRSDIWSLGIVLYELLQGAPPFGGDTFSSMVLKVVNDPLPRLTVRLPGDLEDIVYRCLEKDPARRFQNTADLAQALAKYAQSEVQAAITVQRTRSIVGAPALPTVPEPGRPRRAMSSTLSGAAGPRTITHARGRRWPVVVAAGALIAVVLVVITASRGGDRTDGVLPTARPDGSPKTVPVGGPDPADKMVTAPKPAPQSGASGPASPPQPPAIPQQPAATPPASPPATAPSRNSVVTAQPPSPTPVIGTGSAGAPQTAPPATESPAPANEATPSATTRKKKRTGPATTAATPGAPPTGSPATEDGVLGTRK